MNCRLSSNSASRLARESPSSRRRRSRHPASARAPSAPGRHSAADGTCDACGAARGRSPLCSGAWTCLAMRGDAAIRCSRSSEKSIGSTELSRRRSTSVSASSRRIRSASRMRAARFPAPAAQVDAAQHHFAIARGQARAPASTTCAAGALRLRPRTNGMMQNEQRLLQPSWIFRFGRVRSPAASSTGAERKSCCAKMSPM